MINVTQLAFGGLFIYLSYTNALKDWVRPLPGRDLAPVATVMFRLPLFGFGVLSLFSGGYGLFA